MLLRQLQGANSRADTGRTPGVHRLLPESRPHSKSSPPSSSGRWRDSANPAAPQLAEAAPLGIRARPPGTSRARLARAKTPVCPNARLGHGRRALPDLCSACPPPRLVCTGPRPSDCRRRSHPPATAAGGRPPGPRRGDDNVPAGPRGGDRHRLGPGPPLPSRPLLPVPCRWGGRS